MPAIHDEANQVVTVIQDYIHKEKLTELLIRLDEDIGKKSENEITKAFLSHLRKVVDKPLPPPPMWLWISFYSLVVFHILLVIAVIFSFFVLPFLAPWYVAVPCMTFIWFFSTTRVDCQLTNLENYIRRQLGLKRIGGFVGHYFLKPARLVLRRYGLR